MKTDPPKEKHIDSLKLIFLGKIVLAIFKILWENLFLIFPTPNLSINLVIFSIGLALSFFSRPYIFPFRSSPRYWCWTLCRVAIVSLSPPPPFSSSFFPKDSQFYMGDTEYHDDSRYVSGNVLLQDVILAFFTRMNLSFNYS